MYGDLYGKCNSLRLFRRCSPEFGQSYFSLCPKASISEEVPFSSFYLLILSVCSLESEEMIVIVFGEKGVHIYVIYYAVSGRCCGVLLLAFVP